MNKNGYIEKVSGNIATIRVKRDSACGDNCGNCNGCNSIVLVEALNKINAKVGDKVEIELDSRTVINTAFIVYIIPIIALIIGYITGSYLFEEEFKIISVSFTFFIICILITIAYSCTRKNKIQNKIIRIL